MLAAEASGNEAAAAVVLRRKSRRFPFVSLMDGPIVATVLQQAAEIVVICHHGIRSQHVIHFLQANLDGDLVNLDGGVDAWAREVDRDMPVY